MKKTRLLKTRRSQPLLLRAVKNRGLTRRTPTTPSSPSKSLLIKSPKLEFTALSSLTFISTANQSAVSRWIFSTRPQRLQRTSVPSALEKKASDVSLAVNSPTKAPNSTESFLASWLRVVTLPTTMAPVVNPSMENGLTTRDSLENIPDLVFYLWPMLDPTPMEASSLFALLKLPILTDATLFLAKYVLNASSLLKSSKLMAVALMVQHQRQSPLVTVVRSKLRPRQSPKSLRWLSPRFRKLRRKQSLKNRPKKNAFWALFKKML